jgi:hypothetical protein
MREMWEEGVRDGEPGRCVEMGLVMCGGNINTVGAGPQEPKAAGTAPTIACPLEPPGPFPVFQLQYCAEGGSSFVV